MIENKQEISKDLEKALQVIRPNRFAVSRQCGEIHHDKVQNGEKITLKHWKAEIQSLQSEYDSIGKEQTMTATELAYAEVIGYSKKNLEREIQNESRQHNRQQNKTKRREEKIE